MQSLTSPQHGGIAAFPDGSLFYTPNTGFVGTDTFTYTISDGVTTDTATITISVLNEAPVAMDDEYSVRANQVLSVAAPGLLANDTDADGDTLIVQSLTSPQHGGIAAFPDGSLFYTPNTGFVGTDTFTYTISDGVTTDTATITISVLDETPVAVDDAYSVHANRPLVIQAPGLVRQRHGCRPGHPDARHLTQAEHGTVVAFGDGSFTYTPNTGFIGTDRFTYFVTDGVLKDDATVTIAVLDQAPIAGDDAYTVRANQTLTIPAPGVLGNDTDADQDTRTLAHLTQAVHGTVVAFADGSFTYTPQTGFVGSDSFSYFVTDGVVDDEATVTISVLDEKPVAADDSYSVRANRPLVIQAPGFLANDTDADQDTLTLAHLTQAETGRWSPSATGRSRTRRIPASSAPIPSLTSSPTAFSRTTRR